MSSEPASLSSPLSQTTTTSDAAPASTAQTKLGQVTQIVWNYMDQARDAACRIGPAWLFGGTKPIIVEPLPDSSEPTHLTNTSVEPLPAPSDPDYLASLKANWETMSPEKRRSHEGQALRVKIDTLKQLQVTYSTSHHTVRSPTEEVAKALLRGLRQTNFDNVLRNAPTAAAADTLRDQILNDISPFETDSEQALTRMMELHTQQSLLTRTLEAMHAEATTYQEQLEGLKAEKQALIQEGDSIHDVNTQISALTKQLATHQIGITQTEQTLSEVVEELSRQKRERRSSLHAMHTFQAVMAQIDSTRQRSEVIVRLQRKMRMIALGMNVAGVAPLHALYTPSLSDLHSARNKLSTHRKTSR